MTKGVMVKGLRVWAGIDIIAGYRGRRWPHEGLENSPGSFLIRPGFVLCLREDPGCSQLGSGWPFEFRSHAYLTLEADCELSIWFAKPFMRIKLRPDWRDVRWQGKRGDCHR